MQELAAIPGRVVHDETLPARAYWHRQLQKGSVLRIVDLEGCQSVDTLIYDAVDTAIRYNAANTMKLAKSIYLSKGCVLYDDLARPLMTIVEDTVGHHDTLAGNCSREINMVRYGATAPSSCRDNFLKALGELGMGPRDIPANINFFMNVPVSADGHGGYHRRHLKTRRLCRSALRQGCARGHFQLPAGAQPLLGRQADANPAHHLAAQLRCRKRAQPSGS